MTTALIVPAAGSGRRMAMGRPKALLDVGGVPLLRRTLDRFLPVRDLAEAVIVSPAGAVTEIQAALVGLEWPGCQVGVVTGGATRQESVRRGLEALAGHHDLVCVHDAARPLISRATIRAVLTAAAADGAASAARRATDTVREEVGEGVTRTLDRTKIWLVETPQAFTYEILARAHEQAVATGREATDDAALVEACLGITVRLVETEGPNFKVTRPEDLRLIRQVLGAPSLTTTSEPENR